MIFNKLFQEKYYKDGIIIGPFWIFQSDKGYSAVLGTNGCLIIITNSLADTIINKSISTQLLQKLISHNLAYTEYLKSIQKSVDPKPRYFILDITKKCNMKCIYCFRAKKDNRSMSNKMIEKCVSYISDYCKSNNISHFSVQGWGGEPTMEIEKIELIRSLFKKEGLNPTIDVETNASLVSDIIARRLFKANICIGVSLDGTGENQNRQRPFANGTTSNDAVCEGIKSLQKYYGERIGVICIITKHNYLSLHNILKHFIFDLNLKSIKFNIVRDNIFEKESNLTLNNDELKSFITSLYDESMVYYRMNNGYSEGNIRTRFINILSESGNNCCISKGCEGGKSIVSMDLDGNIFPCEMIDFENEKIGSIFDGDIEHQLNIAHNSHPFFKQICADKCLNCEWHHFCRGGCTSRLRYGCQSEFDEVECSINKIMYPKIIETILENPQLTQRIIE